MGKNDGGNTSHSNWSSMALRTMRRNVLIYIVVDRLCGMQGFCFIQVNVVKENNALIVPSWHLDQAVNVNSWCELELGHRVLIGRNSYSEEVKCLKCTCVLPDFEHLPSFGNRQLPLYRK